MKYELAWWAGIDLSFGRVRGSNLGELKLNTF